VPSYLALSEAGGLRQISECSWLGALRQISECSLEADERMQCLEADERMQCLEADQRMQLVPRRERQACSSLSFDALRVGEPKMRQKRKVSSAAADTTVVPSGLRAMWSTRAWWPVSSVTFWTRPLPM